ncbi:MAG: tRNA pseudouridine(55) synthase TruB [Bacteroidales bacterium]|jgi:tRNA pseudouridine55 synthase|nr:tRNA pseudouridine(55) synthase TruB [Bacteroidales bacterium]
MQQDYTREKLQKGEILAFNKPYGWTSYYLVNKIRYFLCKFSGLKKLKVGHAGTLDPLATGLLILCTGKATKRIGEIQNMPKEYIAEIQLGATTPSYDLETKIDQTFEYKHINEKLIAQRLNLFKGKIQQIPPLYSAKNIRGIRAYELAREGVTRALDPVEVEIFSSELIEYKSPLLKIKIICSKGTYIRAIARDLGKSLNSGGYLTALERTAIGNYSLADAFEVEKFKKELNIL